MVDREEQAASTAMFRAFAARRDAEAADERKTSPVVWVVGLLVIIGAVVAAALLLT